MLTLRPYQNNLLTYKKSKSMTPQMILQEFIREFRYVPHEQLLDYNPYWPCIQNYLGVVTKYNWPASLQPFKYTIPYFYLDAE